MRTPVFAVSQKSGQLEEVGGGHQLEDVAGLNLERVRAAVVQVRHYTCNGILILIVMEL